MQSRFNQPAAYKILHIIYSNESYYYYYVIE